ncbi:hypothetical protein ABMA79_11990 [Halobacteriovorax sp. HFRX-2_2]|uniref:hypothetical protein n=1 Tax=unclassified Halobacteriovorax TaxID=2639665 RepID=UPI0037109E6B
MKTILLVLTSLMSTNLLASGVITSEGEFREVIESVLSIYDQQLPQGKNRQVDINWESKTLNASVGYKRHSESVRFSFHGEFVRKNKLTKDAFALIACHEVGHIIGGHPKVMPTQKYSSEAQSDYFATNECLKKYFASNSSDNFEMAGISAENLSECKQDKSCLRGLSAIRDASVIYPGSNINSKSDHVSKVTIFNDYPQSQCRVDTLKAGLLNQPRPNCWFKSYQSERYEYQYDYEYEEAQGVAEITEVTATDFGCHIRTKYPDVWMGSYLNPLSESELMLRGVRYVGTNCKYQVGDTLSGAMTLFRGNLYLNLNPTDK